MLGTCGRPCIFSNISKRQAKMLVGLIEVRSLGSSKFTATPLASLDNNAET